MVSLILLVEVGRVAEKSESIHSLELPCRVFDDGSMQRSRVEMHIRRMRVVSKPAGTNADF